MALFIGLPVRIIAVASIAALAGAGSTLWITRDVVHRSIGRTVHHDVNEQIRRGQFRACDASPSQWHGATEDGVLVDAYDGRSLISHNPNAPALDSTLREKLVGGASDAMTLYGFGSIGGALVVRTAPEGPCAVLQIRWPVDTAGRTHTLRYALVLLAGLLAATAMLVLVLIIAPLRKRVAELRTAVRNVGNREHYVRAATAPRDGLGELAEGVDAAHVRIVSDTERIAAQQHETEQFLEDVMHDLRTPITSLQLAMERLGAVVKTPDEQLIIQGALLDAVYLHSLTENLRMARSLEDGDAQHRGRVGLCALLDRIELRERVFARARNVELAVGHPDADVLVDADELMLERTVTNLIQNAVAHGSAGGHVSVVLEHARSSRVFQLVVSDDGPGVPPLEIPRLGHRAFRSDNARAREPKGSGLGLAICRAVCDAHGWTLEFSPAEPAGLRVVIAGTVVC